MLISLRQWVCIFTVLMLMPLYADVYRYVDKNGNVIFTDSPPAGVKAKKIKVKEPTTESAYQPENAYQKRPEDDKPATNTPALENYNISVSSPENGTTVNAAGGSLNVVVSVQPAPQQGYKIKILVDGYEAVVSNSPIATVSGLNRGKHSFNAQLLSEDGSVLATSNTSVVTILRPSIIMRDRNKGKK